MLGKATATTVVTQTIEGSNGIRYAYRRFGNSGDVPFVLFQHFTGTLDFWDPALLDALAAEREVIIFNNAGVGSTSGTTPSTVAQMARDALVFIDALKLDKIDVLGFSLGGFIAQEIALVRPRLVRRLVLAGTAPQGGPGLHGWRQDIYDATHTDQPGPDSLLYVMFKQTPSSQAKGMEYLGRFMERKDRDAPGTPATRDAQYDAVVEWGILDHNKLQRLAAITQPTFVANGDADFMCPTRLTHLMGGLIPKAQVKIYPDAGHGFLWQHHEEFAADVNAFLSA